MILSQLTGQGNLKLRITGEVQFYKGRRYILLRKVIKDRDMGEF